jgi:hypothetical protein
VAATVLFIYICYDIFAKPETIIDSETNENNIINANSVENKELS